MEDIETLKKVVERSKELDERFGKGNWRVRTVTSANGGKRLILPLTTELDHLDVKGGDKVIVGLGEVNGRKAIIVEKL